MIYTIYTQLQNNNEKHCYQIITFKKQLLHTKFEQPSIIQWLDIIRKILKYIYIYIYSNNLNDNIKIHCQLIFQFSFDKTKSIKTLVIFHKVRTFTNYNYNFNQVGILYLTSYAQQCGMWSITFTNVWKGNLNNNLKFNHYKLGVFLPYQNK
jgi:hypothetical protein